MEATIGAAEVEQGIVARYQRRTAGSRARHREARRYLPGGETRSSTWYAPYPTYMDSGDGAWLRDVDGNRYLDFLNNYTSLIHGHAQPDVVEEAADQLTRGTVFGSASAPQVTLAQLLIERVPSIDKLRFTNSGSEATMMMMRAARAFKERDIIVKIDGGYHGSHDFVEVNVSADMAATDQPAARIEERGVPAAVLDAIMVAPFNDLAAMERLLSERHRRIAGIIIEPMPNAGGMLPPAPLYLRGLRELADRFDVLLLFDEIVTFRLSSGGMQEVEDVKPDMTALAKIIGGGFPVGAVAGEADVMKVFDHRDGELVHHGGTYNGNPVTMVAGYETMKRLTPEVFAEFDRLGDRVRAGLQEVLRRHGIEAVATGRGSLFAVVPGNEPPKDFRAVFTARSAAPQIQKIAREMLNRGMLMGARGLFGALSTPMGDAEIDRFLEAADGAAAYVLAA